MDFKFPENHISLFFAQFVLLQFIFLEPLRGGIVPQICSFFNIVQKAVDPPAPPPFVLNIAEQIFFDGFLKKRVNVCRDIIWQNNA